MALPAAPGLSGDGSWLGAACPGTQPDLLSLGKFPGIHSPRNLWAWSFPEDGLSSARHQGLCKPVTPLVSGTGRDCSFLEWMQCCAHSKTQGLGEKLVCPQICPWPACFNLPSWYSTSNLRLQTFSMKSKAIKSKDLTLCVHRCSLCPGRNPVVC